MYGSKPLLGFALALIVGMWATQASAEQVTIVATGMVIGAVDNNDGLLPFSATVGNVGSLTFTYESSAADTDPLATSGNYFSAMSYISLTIGSQTVAFIPPAGGVNVNQFYIYNDRPLGASFIDLWAFTVRSLPNPALGGAFQQFNLQLGINQSTPSPMLLSDALGTPPSVQGADANNLQFAVYGPSNTLDQFSLRFDSIGVAPVPVPAAVWLLLSGLGGLGAFSRRTEQFRLRFASA